MKKIHPALFLFSPHRILFQIFNSSFFVMEYFWHFYSTILQKNSNDLRNFVIIFLKCYFNLKFSKVPILLEFIDTSSPNFSIQSIFQYHFNNIRNDNTFLHGNLKNSNFHQRCYSNMQSIKKSNNEIIKATKKAAQRTTNEGKT